MKCPDCQKGKIPFEITEAAVDELSAPTTIIIKISCPTCKGTGKIEEEEGEE